MSAIIRIGSNSAEAASLTIPTGHQSQDVLLIYAFRDGNATAPSLPTGWTSLGTATATSTSARVGWKLATSSSETSGTWTNATGTMVHVYRGVDPTNGFGTLTTNSGTASPSTYGATTGLTKARMGNSWLVAFQGHRSVDTTTLTTAPTGYTLVITALGATSDMVSFDTNGCIDEGFASNTVAPGGTASGWITAQIPIYPVQAFTNNFRFVQSKSAGIISVGERIR